MTRKRLMVGACLVAPLLFLVSAAYAGSREQDPTVLIRVRVFSQVGPVRILAMRLPGGPGHAPLVHLQNASSIKTVRLWVDAIISNSEGRTIRTDSNGSNLSNEHRIAPGADVWAAEAALASGNLLMAARELRSNCISVRVLIGRVDFADGSHWGPRNETALFARDADNVSCRDRGTALQGEVERIAGTTYETGSAPYSSAQVQSYSVSCSLESKGGGQIFGLCPF